MLAVQNATGADKQVENKCHVLIVDDDTDILAAWKELLELEFNGFRISIAEDDETALNISRVDQPDLVLLDINLGQTTGLELLPELRKLAPDLRTIMMTAHRDIEFATKAISIGVNEYLLKPVSAENLLQCVEQQLSELERQRKINVAEKTFHIIFDYSEHILITLDNHARIIEVNNTLLRLSGMDRAELVDLDIWNAPWWNHSHSLREKIRLAIEDNCLGYGVRFETTVTDRNQQVHTFLFSMKPVMDSNNNMTQILVDGRDITDQKQNENVLKQLAYHDPLTRLPNRYSFNLRLHEMLESAEVEEKSFALLFIDLDNFKQVNDIYGHLAGDEVLVEIAYELKNCLRAGDFIARLGGDEFTVILAEENRKIIDKVANKIVTTAGRICLSDGRNPGISTSIGIAIYPDGGVNASTLMKSADFAMYQAKQAGKNCYHYFSKMD